MTRQQAKDALRQIVLRSSDLKRQEATKPMTFGQFWRERFLPMYEGKWKISSRQTQIDNIERYCVEPLETIPLVEVEKFQLQMITNRLAQRYSKSVVTKFLIWSRAILEEAVDQDFIVKNPARKLVPPETRPENKRFLQLHEIPMVLSRVSFREALVLRMSFVLGLRPGELLALRWDDIVGHALRLDESTIDGQIYPTLKTKESKGFVALPSSLRTALDEWRKIQNPSSEQHFIFPNADGGVYRLDNYRADVLRPALKRVADETGITGIDSGMSSHVRNSLKPVRRSEGGAGSPPTCACNNDIGYLHPGDPRSSSHCSREAGRHPHRCT
jgi:integrase